MMRQDLNDLYFFVQVVRHGGFAPAGRVLGVPKSRLSRRIARLEGELGVRLIQRSSRSFAVTQLGQSYYERCCAMLVEADAAQALVQASREELCGLIRLSCPIGLLHARVADMLTEFGRQHPGVRIQLLAMNRALNVVEDHLDLALRARPLPLDDSDLPVRVLGYAPQRLLASPELLQARGRPDEPGDLAAWPGLGYGPSMDGHAWVLQRADGEQRVQPFEPRLVTSDMLTLCKAALSGMGVVQLPEMLTREYLQQGLLQDVLPAWTPRREVIHAILPSRRGVLPAVRALIEFLAARFQGAGQADEAPSAFS